MELRYCKVCGDTLPNVCLDCQKMDHSVNRELLEACIGILNGTERRDYHETSNLFDQSIVDFIGVS